MDQKKNVAPAPRAALAVAPITELQRRLFSRTFEHPVLGHLTEWCWHARRWCAA